MDKTVSVEFEPWYRAEYSRVLTALTLVTGDGERARDATDEAFARALARWRSVSQMENPGGWTYRVALNVVRSVVRRAAIEKRLLRRDRPDVVPPPAVELWHVVRQLPPRQREIVVLRYLLDMREREIAATLGIRRGTVSRSLSTAHGKLRGWLSEEEEDSAREQENV
ncbi:MAG: sigma-70 family RNA polymerase sigma factor [Nocardiopsaceae bacterium]|nr:sigma-70 family RNA polymerase sigma factor [Nocardiopsaceae bacterium]